MCSAGTSSRSGALFRRATLSTSAHTCTSRDSPPSTLAFSLTIAFSARATRSGPHLRTLSRLNPHSRVRSGPHLRTRSRLNPHYSDSDLLSLGHRAPPSHGASHPSLRQSGEDTLPSPGFPRCGDRELRMSIYRTVMWKFPPSFSLYQQALSSTHSSTVRPSSWVGVLAGNLADAEPRLHPSRGECRHTVLVCWRVPLMVCVVVGEVASSRA